MCCVFCTPQRGPSERAQRPFVRIQHVNPAARLMCAPAQCAHAVERAFMQHTECNVMNDE